MGVEDIVLHLSIKVKSIISQRNTWIKEAETNNVNMKEHEKDQDPEDDKDKGHIAHCQTGVISI